MLSRPSTEREKIINTCPQKKEKGLDRKKIDQREANNLHEARLINNNNNDSELSN